jgi:hypothetical protein
MRSKLFLTAFMAANGWSLGAAAQEIHLYAKAYGNLPETNEVDNQYFGVQWAAAGYKTSAHVSASSHPWDPPSTASYSDSLFDQSTADGAILRTAGMVRQPYRGSGANKVGQEVIFDLKYSLKIENLSGQALNIVLGNDLHGTIACADAATLSMSQNCTYMGPSGGGLADGSVDLNANGATTKGAWNNTLSPTMVTDVVYGQVPGFTLNSYQFLGQEHVAAGVSIDIDIEFYWSLVSSVAGSAPGGLGFFDFGNTGHLTTKAFDPASGEDRSSEIRVTVVATPTPGSAAVVVVVGLGALRRKRTVA